VTAGLRGGVDQVAFEHELAILAGLVLLDLDLGALGVELFLVLLLHALGEALVGLIVLTFGAQLEVFVSLEPGHDVARLHRVDALELRDEILELAATLGVLGVQFLDVLAQRFRIVETVDAQAELAILLLAVLGAKLFGDRVQVFDYKGECHCFLSSRM
jgi:hypothetical protein